MHLAIAVCSSLSSGRIVEAALCRYPADLTNELVKVPPHVQVCMYPSSCMYVSLSRFNALHTASGRLYKEITHGKVLHSMYVTYVTVYIKSLHPCTCN